MSSPWNKIKPEPPVKPKRKVKRKLTVAFNKDVIDKVRHAPGWPVEDDNYELAIDPIIDQRIFAVDFTNPDKPECLFQYYGKRTGYLSKYFGLFTINPVLRIVTREQKNALRVSFQDYLDRGTGMYKFRWDYNTHEWDSNYLIRR